MATRLYETDSQSSSSEGARLAQCLLESGGSGQVPVGQPHGEAVDEQLRGRFRTVRPRRRGSRGPCDLPDVLPVSEAAGVDRGYQGFEIGSPGQLGVQALQPLRGPQDERRRVTAPSQRERALRPHPLHAGLPEFAQRSHLSGYQ